LKRQQLYWHQQTSTLVTRAGILFVGALPVIFIFLGFGEGGLVQFIVLLFTALMASSFCTPVVGGILWKRTTKGERAIAAMVGSVSAAIVWKLVGYENIDTVVPGFQCYPALMIGVSLVTKPPP